MGRIVTVRYLFKQFLLSTLVAIGVSLFVHTLKVQLQTPDQEPDSKTCAHLSTVEATGDLGGFTNFYAFYLCEHSHPKTKLLHYIGSFNAGVMMLKFADSGFNSKFLIFGIVQAYSFAWVSHFYIEQNKPATFRHPLFSFASDWVMFKDLTFGAYRMW